LAFVQRYFADNARQRLTADEHQVKSAFVYACGYGREDVVRLLLQRGIDPRTDPDVRSCLHWAVYGGRVQVIKLLLDAGAAVNLRHARDQLTPLEVALVGWSKVDDDAERQAFYEVVRVLVAYGATLDRDWFRQDDRRA